MLRAVVDSLETCKVEKQLAGVVGHEWTVEGCLYAPDGIRVQCLVFVLLVVAYELVIIFECLWGYPIVG